ncbi:MAG: hypothetical protein ACYSVY_14860 [Planctomycetota bacterium]
MSHAYRKPRPVTEVGRVRRQRVIACVVVGLIAMAAGPGQAADGGTDGATVEVCGLRIVGPSYGDEDTMRPFNWSTGTTLVLQVVYPGGGLIGFDGEAAKVATLADEKGKDLLVKGRYTTPGFSFMPSFSEDGKAAIVEITGGGVPTRGASQVRAEGTMVFNAASKTETHKQTDVALERGAKIKAGPIPFTIKKVGKPDWGEEPLQITLETNQATDTIASVRFLDDKGKEIKSSAAGGSRMSLGSQVQIEKNYNLQEKVVSVTVEITYWTDMRPLEVPFNVTATVGL